ncbi:MAG: hypothetical protein AB8C46_15190 [Burkholderiaceae bacterium]
MSNTTPRSPLNRDTDSLAEATPWYLNDTLTDEDRAWLEQEMENDAGLANAVKFDEQIAASLQARAEEVPANIGWEKLLKRARADQAAPVAVQQSGIGDKIGSFFNSLFSPRMGAVMAALVVVQAGVISYLSDGGPAPAEYRSVGTIAPKPVIRAILTESVTEKQLRSSLAANGVSIVAGPTQLGEYLLTAPKGSDLKVVGGELEQAGVVTSFSLDTYVPGQ